MVVIAFPRAFATDVFGTRQGAPSRDATWTFMQATTAKRTQKRFEEEKLSTYLI